MNSPTETTTPSHPDSLDSSAHFRVRHLLWFWLPFLVLLILDQITKWWAETDLQAIGSITVVEGFWRWTYVQNTGVAFGMAQGQNLLLAGIATLLVVAGLWWARQLDWRRREVNLLAAMLVAGAIGNLTDRLRLGYVTDFADFTIPLIDYRWPVFNVADSLICIAVSWIVVRQFVGPNVQKHSEVPEKTAP